MSVSGTAKDALDLPDNAALEAPRISSLSFRVTNAAEHDPALSSGRAKRARSRF